MLAAATLDGSSLGTASVDVDAVGGAVVLEAVRSSDGVWMSVGQLCDGSPALSSKRALISSRSALSAPAA